MLPVNDSEMPLYQDERPDYSVWQRDPFFVTPDGIHKEQIDGTIARIKPNCEETQGFCPLLDIRDSLHKKNMSKKDIEIEELTNRIKELETRVSAMHYELKIYDLYLKSRIP